MMLFYNVASWISSKNKSEVIESMDFFVLADAHDIETAYLGIKNVTFNLATNDNMPAVSGQTNPAILGSNSTTVSLLSAFSPLL